ncbi:MAG: hypothetical protein WCW68_11535 [Methanothrix sp.]
MMLVDPTSGKVTGRICHIKGRKPNGSRYDSKQTDAERHAFGNLVLMCPIHHDIIDADSETYTVERLHAIKRQHEMEGGRESMPSDQIADQFIANIEASASRDTFVVSHNQSGGITAGTVNISAAPEPTLQASEVFMNQLEKGVYHSRIALLVDSPYPPANLYIAVHAPSIRRIELAPQRSGLVMTGHSGTRSGMAFENLQSPFGRIYLEIFTGEPESFDIEWDLK